jgi:hypothetical protein
MSLDPSRTLGISRHADLKSRADGFVLVLPERAIRIGGSGAEILHLIAEGRTGGAVLAAMRDRYANSPELASEVLGFLEEMLALGGVVCLDGPIEKTS